MSRGLQSRKRRKSMWGRQCVAQARAQKQGAVGERAVGEEGPCVVVGAHLFPSGLWWSGI